MIRHWASAYIKLNFTWDYSFRTRFVVLRLVDPSHRQCYGTLLEFVSAALSTDSFFGGWEVLAPSVNP